MFHYEFRKSLALALIAPTRNLSEDPEYASSVGTNIAPSVGRRRKRSKTVITRSTVDRLAKSCRVNNNTLHPLEGQLRCRLNKKIGYYPDDGIITNRAKSLRCALHRWVDRGAQIKRDVMVYFICTVALCVGCYRKFHTEPSVDRLRSHVVTLTVDNDD